MSRRPNVYRISIAVAVIALPLGGGALYLNRDHTIEYSAFATDCSARVQYAGADEELERDESFEGSWESGPVEVAHGRTATISVISGSGCEEVRCELLEDGELVSEVTGRAVAICSAYTAR